MRKIIATTLIVLSMTSLHAYKEDEMARSQEAHNELYAAGCGAEDGAYTAINTSMLGWGLGLGMGIALLAGSLHQSTSENGHSIHCCHCD